MNKAMKRTLILIIILGICAAAVMAATKLNTDKANSSKDSLGYTVVRGPLSISITESGTIKSKDQFIVKSEVAGRTSVVFVIPEGTQVKEGDLLVELDSSELNDRLVDQQIQVENSDSDFVSAKEKLEVSRIQTQSNIAKAELDNKFAIEDKDKYLNGEWPKMLMEAETDLTLAKEELRRATDKFEWSKKLKEEQYLSDTEYKADDLARKRSELQVSLAEEKLKLLKDFTHTRKIDELDSEIRQKSLALDRVNRESSSELIQAQSRLRAREAELKRQKARLEKIKDQISKTKMFAPADGMVVYASSSEFSWRGDTQPLAEGQEVYEQQELIHLPAADSMMVVVKIHESALGKVKLGQKVRITIDAISGKEYTGEVTRIAPLPDAASVWMNPDLKVYDTNIMIDGVDPKIRTGMSCKATILIDEYDDALFVPMQAVVGQNGQTMVYVKDGSKLVATPVTTGLDNNAMIHIIDGLNPGDEVTLTPPLSDEAPTSKKPHKPTGNPGKPMNRPRSAKGKQP